MVVHARVTAAFRRLVALLARSFYAGECPPKSAEELAAPVSAKTKQQVEQDVLHLALTPNKRNFTTQIPHLHDHRELHMG